MALLNNFPKITVWNMPRLNTTYLQGIAGHVEGTPAGELKVGDTMIWNYFGKSTVVEIVRETAHFIIIREGGDWGEKTHIRRYKKDRIVARPTAELNR